MRFLTDEPAYRFHLRCALFIALGAALATLVGSAVISFERVTQLEESQRGANAESLRLRQQLERMLTEAEDRRVSDNADIEQRLRAIAAASGSGSGGSAAIAARATAPFPAEDVLGSIAELVCIDNQERETYYTGSATVIDPSGLLITNRHLLVSQDGSIIRFCGVGFTSDLHVAPKMEYVAQAMAADEGDDLALLRITERLDGRAVPKTYPAVPLSGSRQAAVSLRLGDPIYIGGYPGIGAETFTFTQGVVSGRVGDGLIKTSALIDSGTSGGAAFDSAGRFIGIPTAAVKGEIGGSLGFLIGANTVDEFMAGYRAGKDAIPSAP